MASGLGRARPRPPPPPPPPPARPVRILGSGSPRAPEGPPLARPPPVSEAGQGQRFIYATGSVRRAPRDCDGFNDGADDDGCVLGGVVCMQDTDGACLK